MAAPRVRGGGWSLHFRLGPPLAPNLSFTVGKAVHTSAIQLQYNCNARIFLLCCKNFVVLQQSVQAQYKRKLVLQRCIAGVRT